MAATLLGETVVIPTQKAELYVGRTDIEFHNVAPGRVRINVRVSNHGDARSEPEVMTLQAAPLGAFVPWRDLTSLIVPPIEAHDSVDVSTEVSVSPTQALGEFDQVPPGKLLTAMGFDDEQPPTGGPNNPSRDAVPRSILDRILGRSTEPQTISELPPDPMQLLNRPQTHWAGNINVLMRGRAQERHMAQALRIYPGVANLALLVVGDRRDPGEEYQFALTISDTDWETALYDYTGYSSLSHGRCTETEIPLSKWIPIRGHRMVVLAVAPPDCCEFGAIEVHVRQRSTDREAVVEFSLDARAAGPGCYTV